MATNTSAYKHDYIVLGAFVISLTITTLLAKLLRLCLRSLKGDEQAAVDRHRRVAPSSRDRIIVPSSAMVDVGHSGGSRDRIVVQSPPQ
jgi:hypothetical protein